MVGLFCFRKAIDTASKLGGLLPEGKPIPEDSLDGMPTHVEAAV
jgi:hypothetical protein